MDNFYNSNDNFPPQTPPYYEQPQRYQGSSSCASATEPVRKMRVSA